jgi:hypothetical protein
LWTVDESPVGMCIEDDKGFVGPVSISSAAFLI